MVRAPKARNAVTKLPHGTSLLDLRSSLPVAADRQVEDGLQVFSQESALLECSPNFFSHNSTDVYAVLLMVRDASGLLARLNEGDREQRNAMAARGYWLAFQSVQQRVGRVLRGDNPGQVADDEYGAWYRELFAPSVASSILKPADLAGYRNSQVYIRKSMHVPLNRDAVRDALPAFFDLLREEAHPAVRVVLGYFLFVYIHPYRDGNGRVGRFLMNVMLA